MTDVLVKTAEKKTLTLFYLDRDECDHPYLYLILLTSKADYSIVLISSVVWPESESIVVVFLHVCVSLSLSLK